MKLKKRTISFFKSKKVNIFFLFLLLALLFSLLTKLTRDYTKTITLNIEPTNIPEDKVIIKDSIQKLDVTLTTYGFKLIRYYFNTPTVNLDVSYMDKNEEYYIWTQQKGFSGIVSQFDPNVTINTINPDTLKLRYDSNAVKVVPVELHTEVEFSPGYDLYDNYQLEPDSVKVIGPKVLVDSIERVHTKSLKLTEITADISTVVQLEELENDQLRTAVNTVLVQAKVDRFTEGTIDVPVIVKNVPEDIRLNIYPKSIQVIYYASLEEFKNIASNSFIVECDYSEAIESEASYLTPRITQKPDRVKSARLNIKRIEFIVSK